MPSLAERIERAEREEVVDQLGPGEDRPHALEQRADLGGAPQAAADLALPVGWRRVPAGERARHLRVVVRVDVGELEHLALRTRHRVAVLVDQPVEDHALDDRPPLVVRAGLAARPLRDAAAVPARDPQAHAVEPERDVLARRSLAVCECPLEHARHPHVALHRRGDGILGPDRGEDRLQPGHGRELDLVLAERRQDLLDVAQEHGARSHEEDTVARELAAVGVEEVRRPVERDRGLAGAGAPGDDQRARQIGAHGLVLLGLDGGHDVAHATGALSLERREQRTLAHDGETGLTNGSRVEHLVVEADDLTAPLGQDVAATQYAHPGDRGRPVERLGDRRPPVDHQRGVLGVVDAEPSHVEALGVVEVEPPEAERRVADVQRGEPALGGLDRDVPFEPGLVGSAAAHVRVGLGDRGGRGPHRLQALVDRVEVGLLGDDLGVLSGWRHKWLRTTGSRRV